MALEAWQDAARNGEAAAEDSEIERLIGPARDAPGAGRWARVAIALLLLAVLAGAFAAWRHLSGGDRTAFLTERVLRGGLAVTVTVTGSLEAVVQVEVGSELSGIIAAVAVDYNDRVRADQVLATLDSDSLTAQVGRSRAALQAARARVLEARATVTETERSFRRTQQLVDKDWRSENDLDIARAAYDRAQASLALARAEVAEAEAQLRSDETSLAKTAIRAPIDGIVLERRIEPGQTVAAAFESPHLFTLAQDLTRMTLKVDVDEADIGRIEVGQSAVFTVDAYPERSFAADITELRFAPRNVDGVVTYEALLAVDNGDLALRPGMTATAEITVERVANALLVPNAALRFRPEGRGGGEEADRVWIETEGAPKPVPVQAAASDGRLTEILAGDLTAGTEVIVDVRSTDR